MTVRRMIASLLALVVAGDACGSNDEQLQVGGADIVVEFNSTPAPPLRKLVLDWVTKSAKAVTTYYKKFPVSAVHIHILLYDGRGTRSGHTTVGTVRRLELPSAQRVGRPISPKTG